jgi:Domain of Unknown Function (DUF928)
MIGNHLPQKQIQLASIIPLLFLNFASYPSQAQAQLAPTIRNIDSTQNYFAQLQFPDNGAPRGRRRGATGRRDGCPNLKPSITALVPGDQNNNKSFLGKTISEYPTFWVYLPALPKAVFGEFVFQDEQGNDIWRSAIALPQKPGTFPISLPTKPQYALKLNSKYHWYFKLYCSQPQNSSEYLYVDAWVQRVVATPKLQQQLNIAKPREYIAYTDNHIWYDAVTNLANLRQKNLGDRTLTQDWTNLLKTVGLEELANAPII